MPQLTRGERAFVAGLVAISVWALLRSDYLGARAARRGNVTTLRLIVGEISMTGSGLAHHLTSGGRADDTAGRLIENFVLGELARQPTWSDTMAQLLHYRDRDGYEVDGVLEAYAGRVVGVEVKAGETVRAEDFRGLRQLQRRVGDRFVAGYIL